MSIQEAVANSGQMAKQAIDKRELMLGGCAAMQAVAQAIAQIAPTNIPVLLIGASGTGKEFVAQQIHRLSSRDNEPLTKVVCASMDGSSFSTHFSGTGNRNNRPGTVFLKEISELDPVNQRNLLYGLPEIDGDRSDAGPRLISSTALNLEDEIRAGHFRAELYYRINGVSLHLPSLSQRKEDIPDMVELFLTRHSAIQGRTQPYLDAQDFGLLKEFSWPGNIRELENVVKKIVVLGNPKTVISELVAGTTKPRSVAVAAKSSMLKAATQAASRGAERQMILDALGRNRWNRKRAAQELQISYKSLLSKLKQIGAEEPDKM